MRPKPGNNHCKSGENIIKYTCYRSWDGKNRQKHGKTVMANRIASYFGFTDEEVDELYEGYFHKEPNPKVPRESGIFPTRIRAHPPEGLWQTAMVIVARHR